MSWHRSIQNIKYRLIDLFITSGTLLQKLGGFSFPMPILGIYLIVTLRCNLQCPYCFVLRNKNLLSIPEMKAADIEKMLPHLKFLGFFKPRLHLFGGEPTVNQDLLKILDLLTKEKFNVTLRTNGAIPANYFKQIINNTCIDKIIFSIHTNSLEHIKTLTKVIGEKNFQHKKKTRSYICCSTEYILDNYPSLHDFIKEYEDLGCRHIRIQHMKNIGNNSITTENKAQKITHDIEQVKQNSYKIPILFSPNLATKDLGDFYRDNLLLKNTNCLYPWFGAIINPLGEIVMCEGFRRTGDNIFQKPFWKTWNSKSYRQARQELTRTGCMLPSNSRCNHRRYYNMATRYFI